MRYIYFLIFVFSTIGLNAQTNKNYIVRTNFGYHYNHNDLLDSKRDNFNQVNFGEIMHELNFTVSGGKSFKENFYYGLGLSSNYTKHEINPDSDRPEIPDNSGMVSMTSYYNSISIDNSLSPMIFIQYFYNITERFSIAIELNSKYDFNKNITKSLHYNPDISNYSYVKGNEYKTEVKKQYLNIGVQPSLRLDISKNVGLEFIIGSIMYNQKIKDTRYNNADKKTKEFDINFKPENWLIGFYLKI